MEDKVFGGQGNGACHRVAVDHEGNVNGPVDAGRLAVFPGAVERVHDPDPRGIEASLVVRPFLGEYGVVRAFGAERVDDETVGGGVARVLEFMTRRPLIGLSSAEIDEDSAGLGGDVGGQFMVSGVYLHRATLLGRSATRDRRRARLPRCSSRCGTARPAARRRRHTRCR